MWFQSAGYSAAAVCRLPLVARITLCNVLQVPAQLLPAGMQSQSDSITHAVAAALSVAAAAGGGPGAAAAPAAAGVQGQLLPPAAVGDDSELRARQRRQRHSEVQLSHWRLGARDRQ